MAEIETYARVTKMNYEWPATYKIEIRKQGQSVALHISTAECFTAWGARSLAKYRLKQYRKMNGPSKSWVVQ